jgi:DNA-binding transcriptional MocR family regulator
VDAWTPDLTGFPGPKYQAVADALAEAIRRGELGAGDRLPPQRELASRLGFDLTTITRAYDIARRRGLIMARGRAGSFVREAARASIAAALQVDTGLNTPPMPHGDVIQRALSLGLHSVIGEGSIGDFQYQASGGSPVARRAGSLLLSRIGLASEADQVVVTAGGQNALHAVMNAVARPGDRIACGRFVYPGFRAIAQRMGIELVPLPEMTAAALERACREGAIRALYLVPTNDNPTTATVPLAEREALAGVARRAGMQIVEDDAYGLLDPQPVPPVSRFAPELAWYVQSMSKVVSPALRVAFVRAPGVAQALQLAADVHETAVMAPPLNAAVVANWLGNGTFDRLVAAIRGEAAWRLKLAQAVLQGMAFACHPHGYHLWLRLPPGIEADALSHTLAAAGIGAIPSSRFAVGASDEQALRVSLGGVAEREALESALRSLAGHVGASLRRWDAVI